MYSGRRPDDDAVKTSGTSVHIRVHSAPSQKTASSILKLILKEQHVKAIRGQGILVFVAFLDAFSVIKTVVYSVA